MTSIVSLEEACSALPAEHRLHIVCNLMLARLGHPLMFPCDYDTSTLEYKSLRSVIHSVSNSTLIDGGLLGLAYNLATPVKFTKRTNLGQLFAPQWLADYMIDQIIAPPTEACDPAAGSGFLLWQLLKRFRATTIAGYEVDPDLVAIGNVSIAIGAERSGPGQLEPITQQDSLAAGIPTTKFIITSVPAGRAPPHVCDQLKNWRFSLTRLEEWFLLLIITALEPGGEAIVVIPNALRGAVRGIQVRKLLLDTMQLHSVTTIDGPCFRESPKFRVAVLHFSRPADGIVDSHSPVSFVSLTRKARHNTGIALQGAMQTGFHTLKAPPPAILSSDPDLPTKALGELMVRRAPPRRLPKNRAAHPTSFRLYTCDITPYFCETPDITDLAVIIDRHSGTRNARITLDRNFSAAASVIVLFFASEEVTEYVYSWLSRNTDIVNYGFSGNVFYALTLTYICQIRIPVPIGLLFFDYPVESY